MTPGERDTENGSGFDRNRRNRRKAWILVAITAASMAPFILGLGYAVGSGAAARLAPDIREARARISQEEADLQASRMAGRGHPEWEAAQERRIGQHRAETARWEREGASLRARLVPVMAATLAVGLGILFWRIAASPTLQLLRGAGARLAGVAETDARQVLQIASAGVDLPVPKLYVIESPTPNALASGMTAEDAVVAVTTGTLRLLDRGELEGVLTHEVSLIGGGETRLATVVAAIGLFLRIPDLILGRGLPREQNLLTRPGTSLVWRLVLSPLGLYLLLAGPLLAALIRAIVSAEHAFIGDSDALRESRHPDALLRALAKIGGAGAAMATANPAFAQSYFACPVGTETGAFQRLLATHPPVSERIERLAQFQGESTLAALKRAVEDGRKYAQDHPADEAEMELARASVSGRVYRVVHDQPVAIHELATPNSNRVATVEPGSLIVVFDHPGLMRQVNTAAQTFGYLDRGIQLQSVESLTPGEVYDTELRAAAEVRLAAGPRRRAAAAPPITPRQMAFATGFGVVVFGLTLVMLWKLG